MKQSKIFYNESDKKKLELLNKINLKEKIDDYENITDTCWDECVISIPKILFVIPNLYKILFFMETNEVEWRLNGGWMEVEWRLNGGWMCN